MIETRTILVVMISIASFLVYRHYQNTERDFDEKEHYYYVKDYFIGDDRIRSGKPYLWVHVQGDFNARDWENFGSRGSKELNQPYMYLTIKSILERCQESFNVCLIDDDSFRHLIPKWKVNMDLLPSPSKEHYRQFGLTCILYHYGGMTVPASMLVLKDLHPLYKRSLQEKDAFTVQTAVDYPDPKFMGSLRNGDTLHRMLGVAGALLQTDVTAEADFQKALSRWCNQNTEVVCGGHIGVKKTCGNHVDLADLLGCNPMLLHSDLYALYFPAEEIIRRPKYAWFARMSVHQIMESDLELVNYLEKDGKKNKNKNRMKIFNVSF
jgi:hypothetical protein